jgi:CheY-like chemotaxis protein
MTRSVLIIDDDPAFYALAGRILADLGIEVVATAADAAQALEVVQHSRPDAMLVDIGLPDRDGIDLGYELSNLPWAPRVVLTSSDSEAFVAIEAHDGQRTLPFIAKEELASDTLRQAFTL